MLVCNRCGFSIARLAGWAGLGSTGNLAGYAGRVLWLTGLGNCTCEQEQEVGGAQSRMRGLGAEELLAQLPVLQRLLGRLVDCRPNGAAAQDHVVQVGVRPLPTSVWLRAG